MLHVEQPSLRVLLAKVVSRAKAEAQAGRVLRKNYVKEESIRLIRLRTNSRSIFKQCSYFWVPAES